MRHRATRDRSGFLPAADCRLLAVLVLLAACLLFAASADAATVTAVTGTLTSASGTGSTATLAGNGGNYSLTGGWNGAIDLQRSFDAANWETVATFETPVKPGQPPFAGVITDTEPSVLYRFVVKTGINFSGFANYRLSSW